MAPPLDYDFAEELRLKELLNTYNFNIVDDGKLSEHHMWAVRILSGPRAGEVIEVHEDVVRETDGFDEAMNRFEARKRRSKAKRAATQRAQVAAAASSSSSSAADSDEELKAKRDALREKRRRLDAEEAAVQAELEKRAKKRRIQAALDAAADAKAKADAAAAQAAADQAAAAAEVDRLRAELESA